MSNLTSSRTNVSSRSSTRSSSILKSTSSNVNGILNIESYDELFQDSELEIYPNREDASKYSLHQLQIIKKHDIFCFNNLLDFVSCSNEIIFNLFSLQKIDKDFPIPLVKKHTAKEIREFRRLGIEQQEIRSSAFVSSCDDQIINSYKCFGINLPYLKENTLAKSYDVIDQGYESVIREAIHRRGDIIRDMTHNNYFKEPGVILNKTNQKVVLVLQEQTFLHKVSKVRDGFFFKSPKCDGQLKNGYTILCNNCESEVSFLKRMCKSSFKMRNLEIIKSRTRNDVLTTPTLQYLKIEQMAKERVDETNRRNQNKIRHKKHLELQGMSYKFDSESLFPPNLKELGEKFFNEKKVSQDNMMRYLWAESCENARLNEFFIKVLYDIQHYSFVCVLW